LPVLRINSLEAAPDQLFERKDFPEELLQKAQETAATLLLVLRQAEQIPDHDMVLRTFLAARKLSMLTTLETY